MVVVFTSFVLDSDPTIKMLAVGMAVAVLVDASIVRMVLVPSVMSILGARAWWLPGWLDRLIPDLELEGSVQEEPEQLPGQVPTGVSVPAQRTSPAEEEAPADNSTPAQTPKS
jgi:RND superfamily putative drug exporter